MSPPIFMIIPLHAKVDTKVMDPTSTPSHYSRSLGYNRRILPFMNVEVKEGIAYVNDNEEEAQGMDVDKGSYGASMHSSALTTLNVLITLWTFIWASNFLFCLHLCQKICNAFINSFLKPTWIPKIESIAYSIHRMCFQFKKMNVGSNVNVKNLLQTLMPSLRLLI